MHASTEASFIFRAWMHASMDASLFFGAGGRSYTPFEQIITRETIRDPMLIAPIADLLVVLIPFNAHPLIVLIPSCWLPQRDRRGASPAARRRRRCRESTPLRGGV
jgi:hypothetical protein